MGGYLTRTKSLTWGTLVGNKFVIDNVIGYLCMTNQQYDIHRGRIFMVQKLTFDQAFEIMKGIFLKYSGLKVIFRLGPHAQ